MNEEQKKETILYHFHRTGGNGLGYGCGLYMDFYLTQLPIVGNKMQLDGSEFIIASFNGKKLQMKVWYDNGNSGGDEWLVGKWTLDSEKTLEAYATSKSKEAVERLAIDYEKVAEKKFFNSFTVYEVRAIMNFIGKNTYEVPLIKDIEERTAVVKFYRVMEYVLQQKLRELEGDNIKKEEE